MIGLVLLGVVLGLDNLAAASGLGLLFRRRGQLLRLGLAFVLFEGAMPLVGSMLGEALRFFLAGVSEVLGAACLAACGVLAIGGALRHREPAGTLDSKAWAFLLPLVLSLDNLLAGVGLGAFGVSPLPAALFLGGVSASLSVAGLLLGHALCRRMPRRAPLVGGLWLTLLAVVSLFGVAQ